MLSNREARAICGSPASLVYGAWTEIVKLVAGADVCHGLFNASLHMRLQSEPDFAANTSLELRGPPRHALDGRAFARFYAKTGCARLVCGSSGDDQRVRTAVKEDVVIAGGSSSAAGAREEEGGASA